MKMKDMIVIFNKKYEVVKEFNLKGIAVKTSALNSRKIQWYKPLGSETIFPPPASRILGKKDVEIMYSE